jgi:hypothetical protein
MPCRQSAASYADINQGISGDERRNLCYRSLKSIVAAEAPNEVIEIKK